MRGKRGISAIVATVLVILITVAAVAIIWIVIIPIINKGATFDDVNTRLDIVGSSGYTFYDGSVDKIYVQVKRGSDESEMVGMDIIFTVGGNSVKKSYNSTYVPGPNQAITIIIENVIERPESVKVVPVINDGGVVKRSSIISKADVVESSETEPVVATPYICSVDNECPSDVNFCDGLDWMVNNSFCNVESGESCQIVEESIESCDKGNECKYYSCGNLDGCSETNKSDGTDCDGVDGVCVGGECLSAVSYAWQEYGTEGMSGPNPWTWNMGYEFVPISDKQITDLCKYSSGDKIVKLYDGSYNVLVSKTVSGPSPGWSCAKLDTPVVVNAGDTYYVAAYLNGAGGYSQGSGFSFLPKIYNDINVISTVYQNGVATLTSNHYTTTYSMYGQVDIGFKTYA